MHHILNSHLKVTQASLIIFNNIYISNQYVLSCLTKDIHFNFNGFIEHLKDSYSTSYINICLHPHAFPSKFSFLLIIWTSKYILNYLTKHIHLNLSESIEHFKDSCTIPIPLVQRTQNFSSKLSLLSTTYTSK